MGTPFDVATAVRATGDGRYAATLDPSWNLFPYPQGGVITAIGLRAMAAELGDAAETLRTLHTTYVAPVTDGELEITVDVLRRGRSMSHLRADVRNAGAAAGPVTTAVFGAGRFGFEFTDLAVPAAPPPADCPSYRDPPPPGFAGFREAPFWATRVEGRTAVGHLPWDVYEPTSSACAKWLRFDETPYRDDGSVDPFALVVPADTMPSSIHERVGPQERKWFGPSVDLTVHVLDEWRADWVLASHTARHAGGGYASVDTALWDCGAEGAELPRLVAYATQVMFFTFLEE